MSDMPDPNLIMKIGAAVTAFFVGAFWRIMKKLSHLEKNTVERPEYNQTISSLRRDIKDAREEFRAEHRETRATIIELLRDKK